MNNPFNPVTPTQFQGWASFYQGNVVQAPPPPPSAFGAAALGQPNGQFTGGWAYPDAWANFYEGKQGFQVPQNQNTPAGALGALNYAQNINNPNDPNLLGWERAYGNPNTILQQDQNWAQSLGQAPVSSPSNQLSGGWQNPEAWAAYYGGTNGFTAPANAGSPASALAAASQIAKTSNPQDNPALLGWVHDYGQPGSVLANTPNWAASLGSPQVNASGQDVGQTNTQGWDSPLAWAAFYGGFQGFNNGQPVDNTLQAAQNWAGVTDANDPSLLGWELDYGNPQTVVSTIQASPAYQAFLAAQQAAQLQAQQQAAQQQTQQQAQPQSNNAAFQQQLAAFNAQQAAQQAYINTIIASEQNLQNEINILSRTDPAAVAGLQNQLRGLQAQLGQAQTQLSAAVSPTYTPAPTTNTAPGFINVAPTEPTPVAPFAGTVKPQIPGLQSIVALTSPAAIPGASSTAIPGLQPLPIPTENRFGQELFGNYFTGGGVVNPLFNTAGSGTNVPSFGTNNIQGSGAEAGAFGLSLVNRTGGTGGVGGDPFNALYNFTNTTFAQAGTAGETVGEGTPAGGPIHPLYAFRGGEGGHAGTASDDPNNPYSGSAISPNLRASNIMDQAFAEYLFNNYTPADFGRVLEGAQSGAVSDLGAPGGFNEGFIQLPPAQLDTGYVSVDDFGRVIPDVGPPQPFSLPDFGGLMSNLGTGWTPPLAPAEFNQGGAFDLPEPSISPPDIVLPPASSISPTPLEEIGTVPSITDTGGQLPVPTQAIQSGLSGNIFPESAVGFPDFAPQTPFGLNAEPIPFVGGPTDFGQGGVSSVPANVFTDPGLFGADTLYQGGYGQPVQDQPPPPQPVSNAEQFISKYGTSTTLRQILQDATPTMLQGYSLETVLWSLGTGVDTPIDLTNPNFLEQLKAALDAGSGWGSDQVIAGLRKAMTGGPQAITDAAQDRQQDVQEGPGAYGQPGYNTVPVYGTPQPMAPPPSEPMPATPNPVPPADIPNVSFPAGYNYPSGTFAAPEPIQAGYNYPSGAFSGNFGSGIQAGYSYLPGTFGEIDPYNFSSAPYPTGGYGGGSPPLSDMASQLGSGSIDEFLKTPYIPWENLPQLGDAATVGMENDMRAGGPGGGFYVPESLTDIRNNPDLSNLGLDWSKFNPTPSENVEDVRSAPIVNPLTRGESTFSNDVTFTPVLDKWPSVLDPAGSIGGKDWSQPPIEKDWAPIAAEPTFASLYNPLAEQLGLYGDWSNPPLESQVTGIPGKQSENLFRGVGSVGAHADWDKFEAEVAASQGAPPPSQIQAGYDYPSGTFSSNEPPPPPPPPTESEIDQDWNQFIQEIQNFGASARWSSFTPTPSPNIEDVRSGYIPAAEPESKDFQWDSIPQPGEGEQIPEEAPPSYDFGGQGYGGGTLPPPYRGEFGGLTPGEAPAPDFMDRISSALGNLMTPWQAPDVPPSWDVSGLPRETPLGSDFGHQQDFNLSDMESGLAPAGEQDRVGAEPQLDPLVAQTQQPAAPAVESTTPPAAPVVAPAASVPFDVSSAGISEAWPGSGAAPEMDLSSQVQRGSANFMSAARGDVAGANQTQITLDNGSTLTVNEKAAPYFIAFLNALLASGYNITNVEGFNDRSIAGTGTPSQHAFGNAIDVNPDDNPQHGGNNLPANISDLAAQYGLTWGGDWSRRYNDPMHFEWTGATNAGPQTSGVWGDAVAVYNNQRSSPTGPAPTGDGYAPPAPPAYIPGALPGASAWPGSGAGPQITTNDVTQRAYTAGQQPALISDFGYSGPQGDYGLATQNPFNGGMTYTTPVSYFGGPNNPNTGAVSGKKITDTELTMALPVSADVAREINSNGGMTLLGQNGTIVSNVFVSDVGPNQSTNRTSQLSSINRGADLSPALYQALGGRTDNTIQMQYNPQGEEITYSANPRDGQIQR